tara:strand:+ start:1195 stop:1659 length:465 start_codon:yes stop_codon:yes gene_type:complete
MSTAEISPEQLEDELVLLEDVKMGSTSPETVQKTEERLEEQELTPEELAELRETGFELAAAYFAEASLPPNLWAPSDGVDIRSLFKLLKAAINSSLQLQRETLLASFMLHMFINGMPPEVCEELSDKVREVVFGPLNDTLKGKSLQEMLDQYGG